MEQNPISIIKYYAICRSTCELLGTFEKMRELENAMESNKGLTLIEMLNPKNDILLIKSINKELFSAIADKKGNTIWLDIRKVGIRKEQLPILS